MVKLLNHMFTPFLVFWRTAIVFAIAVVPFYIPTNSTQSFKFFPILVNSFPLPSSSYSLFLHFLLPFLPSFSLSHTHMLSLSFFLLSYPKECEVIPHCGFDLHFTDYSDVEHFFICLLAFCISSFKKCPFKTFAHF